MAGANFTIDLDSGPVTAALRRVFDVLDGDDRTLLLEDIGEHLLNATKRRAALGIDADGDAWAALSPRYKKRKDAKRPGRGLLFWDNHMLGDQLSFQVEGDAVLVGTAAKYGATHQFGRGPIPARPWLGVSEDDEAQVLRLVEKHLSRAIAGD